jgi:hypothetical protein
MSIEISAVARDAKLDPLVGDTHGRRTRAYPPPDGSSPKGSAQLASLVERWRIFENVEHRAQASAMPIASSNSANVAYIYQIDPDLSITKSYFHNAVLAEMRFERAERRDQDT